MKKTKMLAILVLAFIIGVIPSVAKAKLVACVGDSITYGLGISNRASNCYPAQLATILQSFDSEWETQNFGVSSTTLLRNTNKPYVVENAYNSALASEPDVVIIQLGSNDSARATSSQIEQDFSPDYLALIDAFAQLPSKPKIFICNPPPIFGGGYGSNTTLRDVIIPLIQQLPTYRAVEVIDLYTPLEELGHLFPDYLHPNAEGAKVIAEVIAETILSLRGGPDLNGDGIVDAADMLIMVNYWGTGETLCDIAPPPFGDGIVDVQDLIVLAEHLLPVFLAHWELDETEGGIAYNSVGDHDGTLNGNPLWQPAGGKLNGALQLDGIDDYVSTPFILDPSKRSLSAFAWIKGGAPGQVIISQTGGFGGTWLGTNSSEGKLMTGLSDMYFGALESESVITDGQWHHVGLVYDFVALHRHLYVDGVEVTVDSDYVVGVPSDGGLYIGTGKAMQPGTFFSGLIDDVRIYNRALNAEEIAALAQ